MNYEQSKSLIDVKLWKVIDNNPKKIEKERLNLEKNLEIWIEKDTTILGDDLLLIGRQVKNIDLLFLDRKGNTVIAELKREKTPRDIVSQMIEYASRVEVLDYEALEGIAEKEYKQSEALKLKFKERFDEELPEILNEKHKMVIVAAVLDDSTRKIVEYLADRGVQINIAIFHYFEDNGSKYMARTFLIEPSKLEDLNNQKIKEILLKNNILVMCDTNGGTYNKKEKIISGVTNDKESFKMSINQVSEIYLERPKSIGEFYLSNKEDLRLTQVLLKNNFLYVFDNDGGRYFTQEKMITGITDEKKLVAIDPDSV